MKAIIYLALICSLVIQHAYSDSTSSEGASCNGSDAFTLTLQRRDGGGLVRVNTASLKGSETAIVVMDMWDTHWCKAHAQRVAALIEPMNQTLNAARKLGISVVFSPSDVTKFYNGTPQREIMKTLPKHTLPKYEFNHPSVPWSNTGGCECSMDRPCKQGSPWTRQHNDLIIMPGDYITGNRQELYNLCETRGINTILYMGVAANKCILRRPTGLVSMRRAGIDGIVVRDLVEAISGCGYNPDTKEIDPDFTPRIGTSRVVEHIERYIAPTITGNQLFMAASIKPE